MNKKRKKYIARGVLSILTMILLFELYAWCRLCLFASCSIPTNSMMPTVLPGDYLFVPFTTKIKRNQVCVFKYPYPEGKKRMSSSGGIFYCKRCVGIPGDTFYIDSLGIYRVEGSNMVIGNREMQRIAGRVPVPYDSIYIPRVNDKIKMDSIQYRLYKTCIEYETGDTLIAKKDSVFLGQIYLEEYVFHQNYYYMVGDNVINSKDSRYWGLLPEGLVLGYASFIWFSREKQSGDVRWERLFRSLK